MREELVVFLRGEGLVIDFLPRAPDFLSAWLLSGDLWVEGLLTLSERILLLSPDLCGDGVLRELGLVTDLLRPMTVFLRGEGLVTVLELGLVAAMFLDIFDLCGEGLLTDLRGLGDSRSRWLLVDFLPGGEEEYRPPAHPPTVVIADINTRVE